MNKISLRWRITILMGVLITISAILLTALSINNVTNTFVTPLLQSDIDVKSSIESNEENGGNFINFDDSAELPDGIHYFPKIKLDTENARHIFSVSSYLYMVLVIIGSMIIAYYLAGRAMRPISKFNDEISLIDKNSLSKRVSIPQTKDEITHLSLSFNNLLEQLEQEFEKEKRFSANAAHELKTPLATIITSSQVLQLDEQTTQEEYREYLEITLKSAKRLSSVLDGLLMLNGAELDISFELVCISQMICDIQKEIEPLYCFKNITIKQDISIDKLWGTPLLLYRAFFNIIENAYKYSENNGIIKISTYDENNETVIRIVDNGIGISKDDIEHIFEPFYRADKSRSRKIAGAGLGLSITKQIFNLHKATIIITSEKESETVIEIRYNLKSL